MVDEQDTHGGSAPSTGSNGYIRPGIDDRPDFDKVLSQEDKENISRLTAPMPKKRAADSSVGDEQVQGTKLATDSQAVGSGMAALAAVDTAVPDEASAFMDMRDPMVSADGDQGRTRALGHRLHRFRSRLRDSVGGAEHRHSAACVRAD